MARDLRRLLRPKSVALFGSGWAENVVTQLRKGGYRGNVYLVHPERQSLHGASCVKNLEELPEVPDACFIGVNRVATVDIVGQLAALGCGGAVCFASGFQETDSSEGKRLQAELVAAAGEMPFLGPNCYGYLNYLDNTSLWPDEHGGIEVDRGAAIVAQSSNIAINMTMQKRGLNLSFVVTVGNQAQTQVCDVVDAMIEDEQVSCIGLYLEGFGDIEQFAATALRAKLAGKPIVAIKVGKSEKARTASKTHTASLAGSAAASSALLARLNIIEVESISVFLETLKLLDNFGPLKSNSVASISCSGGEASLMADLAMRTQIEFADFDPTSQKRLETLLGERVSVTNPLDYHTYIWGDVPVMTQCFATIMVSHHAAHIFVLDIPRADRCNFSGYECAIEAICAATLKVRTQRPDLVVLVLSSLPENLEPAVIARLASVGVVTLHGMETGLVAVNAAILAGQFFEQPVVSMPIVVSAEKSVGALQAKALSERAAKNVLAGYGLCIPRQVTATTLDELIPKSSLVPLPWVLKVLGFAHKTDVGGVALGLSSEAELQAAVERFPPSEQGLLLEEYVQGAVAELLVGICRDESGVLVLTLAAGGIYTELFGDSAHLLLPVQPLHIRAALESLRVGSLLAGYRGRPAANWESIIGAIEAICAYAIDHREQLVGLDVNPLLVTPDRSVAVDAMIELCS